MMVNGWIFNKNIGITTLPIFIYSRWRWGMEYAIGTLMLEEAFHWKGFMEQLHMSWDILGSHILANESSMDG
jgi:hypothetical protein